MSRTTLKPPLFASILKSTGLYAVAPMAAKMTGFFLLPVYTRYLTPADYGASELLELTLYIFIVFIGMRFGDTLMYYYAKAPTQSERDRVTSSLFFGSMLLSGGGAVVGYIISPFLSQLVFRSLAYTSYFHYMFAGFALQLPQQVVFSYLRATDRATVYMMSSVAQLVLSATGNVVSLAVFRGGLKGLLLSKVIVSVIVGLGLMWYLFASVRPHFDVRLFASTFRYAAPLGIGGIGFLIIHYGDRFFLERYVSLTQIGFYALAYKLGMLVADLLTPFETYWSAQRFQLVRDRGGDHLFVRICTYQTVLQTSIVILLALFAHPLIILLAGPAYVAAAQYVPWVAFAYLIRGIGQYFRHVFFLEGKTAYDAVIVWIGSLSALLGYAVLIPRFALWGAVAATGMAFSVMFLISFWLAQRVRHFEYEYRRMLTVAVAGVMPILLFTFIPEVSEWMRLAGAIALACLYPPLLWLLDFLNEDEYGLLRRTFRKLWAQSIPG